MHLGEMVLAVEHIGERLLAVVHLGKTVLAVVNLGERALAVVHLGERALPSCISERWISFRASRRESNSCRASRRGH